MKGLLNLLLVSFIVFHIACEDEKATKDFSSEPIIGLWNYNTYSTDWRNNPSNNYTNTYDSITFDFKSNGALIMVDSRQIKEAGDDYNAYNDEGTWEPSGSDSVIIDCGSFSEGTTKYRYQISNSNTLLLQYTMYAGSSNERTFKNNFTRN